MKLFKYNALFCAFLLFVLMSCKEKVNTGADGSSAAATEKREMPKILPEPSPEEVQKKEQAMRLLDELHTYLSSKNEFSEFAGWVGRMKDKNILSNQDRQNYRILALNNQAMKNFPQREHELLTDPSGNNLGYQMKVFLHHVCPEPFNPYTGFEYRSLAGIPLNFTKDSLKVSGAQTAAHYKSVDKVAGKLFVYSLASPLYY